jgi:hypothetical protein
MKRTRHHQEGYVFKKGSAWYLRYYDRRQDWSGMAGTHFVAGWLRTCIGSAYRTKRSRRFSGTRISQQL